VAEDRREEAAWRVTRMPPQPQVVGGPEGAESVEARWS
jgi:hypothetical protein